jgi:hypothetical protein
MKKLKYVLKPKELKSFILILSVPFTKRLGISIIY